MNRTVLRIILVLFVALVDHSFGAGSRINDWSRGQRDLIRDASDGHLEEFSLIHASLLVTPAIDGHSESHWIGQFQWHVQRCAAQIPPKCDDLTRAAAIFRYMHDQMLTREYREDVTGVRYCLRDGCYNCVSSTLIYICLCREMGVQARAVALPNHVFVKLLGSPVLIETTYPRWTQLDPDDPRIDQIRYLREISDVALLGRFFYNQGITWAKQSEFAQAAQCARLSCQFDPGDPAAHANFLATLNNWSLSLCREGRFEQASRLVTQGLSLSAHYEPLVANDVYVHQRWIIALRRDGQTERAKAIERELLERLRLRQDKAEKHFNSRAGRI